MHKMPKKGESGIDFKERMVPDQEMHQMIHRVTRGDTKSKEKMPLRNMQKPVKPQI